jgi:hypothetical protein
MIDAGKFAHRKIGADRLHRYQFSVDKAAAAAELRRMADDIDNGEVLVQRVQSGQVADHADYCMHAIMIEFAVRAALSEPVELRGEHALPIDVQPRPPVGFGD